MLLLAHNETTGFSCQFGCFWCQKPVDINTALVLGPFNDAGITATLAASPLPFTVVGPECLNSPGVQHLQNMHTNDNTYAMRPLREFIPLLIAQLQNGITEPSV